MAMPTSHHHRSRVGRQCAIAAVPEWRRSAARAASPPRDRTCINNGLAVRDAAGLACRDPLATFDRPYRREVRPMHPRFRALDSVAVAVMLLLTASWGFNQVAVKLAIPEVPPLTQAAVRSFGALCTRRNT